MLASGPVWLEAYLLMQNFMKPGLRSRHCGGRLPGARPPCVGVSDAQTDGSNLGLHGQQDSSRSAACAARGSCTDARTSCSR